jgi:hypothetical protein
MERKSVVARKGFDMLSTIFHVLSNFRNFSRHIPVCIIAFGVFFFSLRLYLPPEIFAETTQVTIIHSSNINGHLFPCPT